MNFFSPVVYFAALALLGAEIGLANDASDGDDKQAVWSTVDIQLYGYIKLDAAYDTGQADPGNYVRWVNLDPRNPDDNQFSMTANESRFGMRLRGSDDEENDLRVSGNVEIDFYGGGDENKPRPMLRHAFVDLEWRQSGWQLLAGQTSDLISPLVPRSLNYPVAWWAGNIGYRRPQVRLSKTLALMESSSVIVSCALTRDIGSTTSSFTGVDSGSDAGVPGVQARVGWLAGGRRAGPMRLGLSGHWAREDFHLEGQEGDHQLFDSWSANLDLDLPLTDKATLKAEIYTGANLAPYLGGIGQGVNLDADEEIADSGGWISLDLGPFDRLTHHLGLTLSDPEDDYLEPGDRCFNGSVFWNGYYSLTAHVELALELSYWSTEYVVEEPGPDSADSFRAQFAALYRF